MTNLIREKNVELASDLEKLDNLSTQQFINYSTHTQQNSFELSILNAEIKLAEADIGEM